MRLLELFQALKGYKKSSKKSGIFGQKSHFDEKF